METGRIIRNQKKSDLILPRVGIIKVGKKSDIGYPQSVDYFIATGKYAKLFHDSYGLKPNNIQVVFLSDNAHEVCEEVYQIRDKDGKLYAYGNGEMFEIWNGKEYQKVSITDSPNVMESVESRCDGKKGWEVVLILKFILPMVKGIAGYWQFTTKGKASTIPNIRDSFDSMLNNNGFIKGVVFDLSVEFAKSQKPNTKSRYPVVNLIANESKENKQKLENSFINFNKAIEK